MKVKEFIQIVEHSFPLKWALPGDPCGFLVGDFEKPVKRVLAGLEVSTVLVKQAVRDRADFLLVHHPLIYQPLKRLLENDPVQRLVRELIRKDMALYAAHTNVDLHPEGMAKTWAKRLGCATMKPLAAKPQTGQLKLVTFIPPDHTDRVRSALAATGAGIIGEYNLCSYTSRGSGSFRGSDSSNPFTGKAGAFERAEEDRLEMILPKEKKYAVIEALYDCHPYEEPAYDLYALEEFHDVRQALWIAEFSKKISWGEFEKRIHGSLPKLENLSGVRPDKKRRIKRIAISTGSGNSLISLAANLGVDAYLTGEVGYHDLWAANEADLNVALAGHGHSESFFADTVVEILKKRTEGITWIKER